MPEAKTKTLAECEESAAQKRLEAFSAAVTLAAERCHVSEYYTYATAGDVSLQMGDASPGLFFRLVAALTKHVPPAVLAIALATAAAETQRNRDAANSQRGENE